MTKKLKRLKSVFISYSSSFSSLLHSQISFSFLWNVFVKTILTVTLYIEWLSWIVWVNCSIKSFHGSHQFHFLVPLFPSSENFLRNNIYSNALHWVTLETCMVQCSIKTLQSKNMHGFNLHFTTKHCFYHWY